MVCSTRLRNLISLVCKAALACSRSLISSPTNTAAPPWSYLWATSSQLLAIPFIANCSSCRTMLSLPAKKLLAKLQNGDSSPKKPRGWPIKLVGKSL
ncbi:MULTISPECIES: zinc finger domain-containing protein [unclassified Phormidium]|uniref:zinc finger domain-containing protein n=1 Tax=unclassified Phormidium TaxID=2609805 RepID=UPI0037CB4EF7